jgi:hypothetical protein
MKRKLLPLVLAGCLLQGGAAFANTVLHLDEVFASGATFSGDLTFTDTLDGLLGVSGTLTGSSFGPSPDPIVWTWFKETGASSLNQGPNAYADFLMDGSPPLSYSLFIEINWNNSSGQLVLDNTFGSASPGELANAINYSDQMVSYSVTAVPEAETYAMMMAGLGLIGVIARRREHRQA